MFLGATIPNYSFVDYDDVLNIASGAAPSNTNHSDRALVCVTDLVDCCDAPHTVHGDWYFPNGTVVLETGSDRFIPRFQVNRGPNEVINGQTVYGSVRLFRRFGNVPGRGRFRCELPNAANPSVNQTLYVNICELIAVTHDQTCQYPCIIVLYTCTLLW